MSFPFSFFVAFAVANALRWSYIVRIRDTVLVCLFVYMPAGFVDGWGWDGCAMGPHLFRFVLLRLDNRASCTSGVLLRL